MKKISLLVSLLIMTAVTFAQEEKTSFSLAEAQQYAVDNSERLKRENLEKLIAKRKVWETAAAGLPQIQLEGQFMHNLIVPTTVVDASTFNPLAPDGQTTTIQLGTKFNTTGTLNASQILFNGSYIVGLQISKYYKKFVATGSEIVEEDVRAQVAEAYYNVLISEENVIILDSILKNTVKLLEGTRIVRDLGMITQDKVDQLELSVARMESNIAVAKDQTKLARDFLKLLLCYDFDEAIELTDVIETFFDEADLSAPLAESFDPKSDLNYQLLEQKMELDKYAMKNEKYAYLPSLSAFFQHQYSAQRNEFDVFKNLPWYPTSLWGISLNVPIFSGGKRWARIQQAKIKVEQDVIQLSETERNLRFSEIQKKTVYQSALNQLEFEKKNIKLAVKILNNATSKEDLGSIDMLEVVQAQTQLMQLEGNYIAAISKVLTAKNELDKLHRKFSSK
jgi:outer membrane protein TolC